MRKMKDSGVEWIGEIPEGWDVKRLKYTISNPLQYGASETGDASSSGSIRFIRITDITQDNTLKDDAVYLNSKIAAPYILHDEDLLFARSGGTVGKIFLYFSKYGRAAFAGYLIRATINKNIAYPRYIYYFGLSKAYEHWKNLVFTQATIQNINAEKYANLSISLPSLDEQTKIILFLDTKCTELDALRDDIQAEIDTLEEYKKSVITEAVTKGIQPDAEMKDSGIEWVGKIPKNWKLIKGKYIFTQRNQNGNTKNLELLSPTQKYGVIPQSLYEEITGMAAVKLNEKTNLANLKTIHVGDFCISLRSFQGGFEYSKYEGVVSPAYQVFYPKVEIADGYYKYLFKERSFIDKMNSYTLTLRDGKKISFEDFGNTYIPFPEVKEQKAIADYLDTKCTEIDALISEKKEQLETLAEYKKSLIYEYVTGKKEVCT